MRPTHPAGPHVVETVFRAVLTRRMHAWKIVAFENVKMTDPRTGEAMGGSDRGRGGACALFFICVLHGCFDPEQPCSSQLSTSTRLPKEPRACRMPPHVRPETSLASRRRGTRLTFALLQRAWCRSSGGQARPHSVTSLLADSSRHHIDSRDPRDTV
jgi:hypothetical protein